MLGEISSLCCRLAQGRFIFAVSKGLEVKFSDESLSSPAKGVTPSIKFTEGPCADENTAEFSMNLLICYGECTERCQAIYKSSGRGL